MKPIFSFFRRSSQTQFANPRALLRVSGTLLLAASLSQATAEDKADTKSPSPSPSPAPSENLQGTSPPNYWSGAYWDAQDGKNFWRRLKPDPRRTVKDKASDKGRKPPVNGSLRIRNENRSRQR